MPGGLIQLVAVGGQNIYLNGNPKLSFFKKVFKTFTNFSMESMRLNFNKTTIHTKEKTILTCKIDRNADMLQNMYFAFTLPNIPKKAGEKFKFVQNLGEVIIDNYYISIGGNIIDRQYGQWLHIWSELSLSSNKTYGYSKIIGNVADIYAPDDYSKKFEEGDIQIFKRKVYVPLQFWFTKIPGLSLPLISLQYHSVEVHVELRPLVDLFTVGLSKTPYQESTTTKPTVNDCKEYFNIQNNSLFIDPYIEAQYIFLDTTERTFFATKNQEYLVEQVIKFSYDDLSKFNMLEIDVHNPVKEFIWVFARNDRGLLNKWYDFTDWNTVKLNEKPKITDTRDLTESAVNGEIMRTAKFLFNGVDRMETKDNYYFNVIQPYQHHSFCPKVGIYVYSFSLNPEVFQPSGACNFSKISKIQMYTELIEPKDNYKYELDLYAINYNLLNITAGLAGLQFA